MLRRVTATLLFAGFSAFSLTTQSGCSGSEDGPTPAPDPYKDEAAFCASWAKAACNKTVVEKCKAKDAEECAVAQEAFCRKAVPDVGYDKTNAEECVKAVKEAYKDAVLTKDERILVRSLGGECGTLLNGGKEEGDTCTKDANCNTVEDYKCVIRAGETEGTCQVPEEVGGGLKCSKANEVCADGFYCSSSSSCLAGGSDGDPCGPDEPCGDDSNCVDQGAAMVCKSKAALLENCSDDADCLSGICALAGTNGKCVEEVELTVTEPICSDLS